MIQDKLIQRLHSLGIEELKTINKLNLLKGDYINLECVLPNGRKAKVLDDDKSYYGTQVEIQNSDRCLGIAANEQQIVIFEYGCAGKDAELIGWIKLK